MASRQTASTDRATQTTLFVSHHSRTHTHNVGKGGHPIVSYYLFSRPKPPKYFHVVAGRFHVCVVKGARQQRSRAHVETTTNSLTTPIKEEFVLTQASRTLFQLQGKTGFRLGTVYAQARYNTGHLEISHRGTKYQIRSSAAVQTKLSRLLQLKHTTSINCHKRMMHTWTHNLFATALNICDHRIPSVTLTTHN